MSAASGNSMSMCFHQITILAKNVACLVWLACILYTICVYYMWKQETWHKLVDPGRNWQLPCPQKKWRIGSWAQRKVTWQQSRWVAESCQEWWCQEWYMVVPCDAMMMPGLLNRTVSSCIHRTCRLKVKWFPNIVPSWKLEWKTSYPMASSGWQMARYGKHGSVWKRSDMFRLSDHGHNMP